MKRKKKKFEEITLPSILIGCPATAAKIRASRGKARKAWASILRAAERMLKSEGRD
jgi:hypothetical protein